MKWLCLIHVNYQIKLFALFLLEAVSRKKFCNIGSVICIALSLFFSIVVKFMTKC